jgi:acyl carrier protein
VTPAADKALAVLSDVCQVPASKLTPDTHLIRDLALDSAITMELLMALESELSLEISDVEAAKLVTVGDVLAFVNERLPGAST